MTDTTDPPEAAAPETLVDLIDKLVEPPPPEAISMVPQTWGWWALAGVAGALALWGLARFRAHRRATAYRRAALAQLAVPDPPAADVAVILRRTALAAYPRTDVAGLTGADWITFLETTGTGPLPPEVAQDLSTLPYRDATARATPALVQQAQDWVRSHRVEGAS